MGYQDLANSYSHELQQGTQMQAQANQQMVQGQQSLYDRFQQAYMQRQQMARQAEMDRRQQEQDRMNREHQLAQERTAEERYKSGILDKTEDDISEQFTGEASQVQRFGERLLRAGVDPAKINSMIPKGEHVKGQSPQVAGQTTIRVDGKDVPGEDYYMPGVPSKEGEIVPRSNWGSGLRRKTEKDEADAAAKKASEERQLKALGYKTESDEKKAALAEAKQAELTRMNDWKMKNGDAKLEAILRGQDIRNSRAGSMKVKDVPVTIMNSLLKNDAGLNNIDAAIAAIEKDPTALSLWNLAPDAFTQRVRKGHEDALSALTNVSAVRLHDMSGAAVADPEWARLSRSIPQSTDKPEVAIAKLKALKAEYMKMNDSMYATFSPERGYDRPPTLRAPTPTDTGRTVEMKFPDGTKRKIPIGDKAAMEAAGGKVVK